ncbi:hypothetical protein [Cellvibrio sp. UBA7661]|uniref:hypothetical protein n=1 Tax=Cellvibrio sp. UBA7661 TaxID=1946311 RepID=UPI002F351EB7
MNEKANKTSDTMSTAKRAAILSATIFPGAGLFFLRRYVRGCIFAVPAALIIIMLFKNLFTVAFRLNAELQEKADKGVFDFDVAYLASELHGAFFSSPYWDDGKWLLLASWVLSIISSYYAGQKIDQAKQSH